MLHKFHSWLAAALLLAAPALAQQSKTPPNVVLINMDDMGYGDTEPYGMTGIPTPNFNRMAAEGMRFTHFNSSQPICSASRAGLLTGCYPTRIGIHGALMPTQPLALNPSESTIASLLKARGYHTQMLGKWHLGAKAPYLPIHYGFDHYYGLPYSNDMWPVGYDGVPVTDTSSRKGRHPALPWYQDDEQVAYIKTLADQNQITTTLTEKAVSFITANAHHPFFLYLAHPMPHVPLGVSDKFRGKSQLGLFGDVIMELDWSLGQILQTLDKLHLSENTIVIVTSDNGPWLNFGANAGSSGGLREGKGTTFDGGTRVPCLIRWKGTVAAASINSNLNAQMDILPTIVEATGARLPQHRIDGVSFLAQLTGRSNQPTREIYYYYYGVNNLEAVRYQHWKLVLPHKSRLYTKGTPGVGGLPGPAPEGNPVPLALYDLSHDPGEAYDVQLQYPDIVQHLQHIADSARADIGDGLTQRVGANVRPAAHW